MSKTERSTVGPDLGFRTAQKTNPILKEQFTEAQLNQVAKQLRKLPTNQPDISAVQKDVQEKFLKQLPSLAQEFLMECAGQSLNIGNISKFNLFLLICAASISVVRGDEQVRLHEQQFFFDGVANGGDDFINNQLAQRRLPTMSGTADISYSSRAGSIVVPTPIQKQQTTTSTPSNPPSPASVSPTPSPAFFSEIVGNSLYNVVNGLGDGSGSGVFLRKINPINNQISQEVRVNLQTALNQRATSAEIFHAQNDDGTANGDYLLICFDSNNIDGNNLGVGFSMFKLSDNLQPARVPLNVNGVAIGSDNQDISLNQLFGSAVGPQSQGAITITNNQIRVDWSDTNPNANTNIVIAFNNGQFKPASEITASTTVTPIASASQSVPASQQPSVPASASSSRTQQVSAPASSQSVPASAPASSSQSVQASAPASSSQSVQASVPASSSRTQQASVPASSSQSLQASPSVSPSAIAPITIGNVVFSNGDSGQQGEVLARLSGTQNFIRVNGNTPGAQALSDAVEIRNDVFAVTFTSGNQLLISVIQLSENGFTAIQQDTVVGDCDVANCRSQITVNDNNLLVDFNGASRQFIIDDNNRVIDPSPTQTSTPSVSRSQTATFSPTKSLSSSKTTSPTNSPSPSPSPSITPSPTAFPDQITLETTDGSGVTFKIFYPDDSLAVKRETDGVVDEGVNVPNNPASQNATLQDATLVNNQALIMSYNQEDNTFNVTVGQTMAGLNATNLNPLQFNVSGGMFDNPIVAGLFGDDVSRLDLNDVSRNGRLLFNATAHNNNSETTTTFEVGANGVITVAAPDNQQNPDDQNQGNSDTKFNTGAKIGVAISSVVLLAVLCSSCLCRKCIGEKKKSTVVPGRAGASVFTHRDGIIT